MDEMVSRRVVLIAGGIAAAGVVEIGPSLAKCSLEPTQGPKNRMSRQRIKTRHLKEFSCHFHLDRHSKYRSRQIGT